jgi:hypothetical protein
MVDWGVPGGRISGGVHAIIKLSQGIGIAEDLLDVPELFLNANTTAVYTMLCNGLKDGPRVVRARPRVPGPVDDANFRWVTDVGLAGPDKGEGGDYLFVPPGYNGISPKRELGIAAVISRPG